jgi:hypothetical protein
LVNYERYRNVKPLSNSPEPEKVNWLPIVNVAPTSFDLHQNNHAFIDAPPLTLIAPALADTETSEAANAVNLFF